MTVKSSIFLFVIFFCLLLPGKALCQTDNNRDSTGINESDEEYYPENDSVDYVYPDYYRITISPGRSRADNLKLSSYANQFYININYCYDKFAELWNIIPPSLDYLAR